MSPLKLYRLALSETETYSYTVEAPSAEEAIKLATANWEDTGFTDWKFEDSECSDYDIISEQEIAS